jgi:hypothetical protein
MKKRQAWTFEPLDRTVDNGVPTAIASKLATWFDRSHDPVRDLGTLARFVATAQQHAAQQRTPELTIIA